MAFRARTASSSSMQRPTMNVIPATPTAHKGEWVPARTGGQARSTCLNHTQMKQIKFYCLVLMYHQDDCFITEGRGYCRQPASPWLLGEASAELSSLSSSASERHVALNIQLDHSYVTNPHMLQEKEGQKVTVRRVKTGVREESSLLSFPQEPLISLCNIQQGLDWHYFIFNSAESLCHVHVCYFPSPEWQPAAHWSITM